MHGALGMLLMQRFAPQGPEQVTQMQFLSVAMISSDAVQFAGASWSGAIKNSGQVLQSAHVPPFRSQP